MVIIYIIIGLLSILLGGAGGYFFKIITAKNKLDSAENRAEQVLREAQLEAESKKKELLLEAKTFLIQERENFEKQTNDRRIELQRLERRLIQKEEQYERRLDEVEKKEKVIRDREKNLTDKEGEVGKLHSKWLEELEKTSGLTTDQAKDLLKKELEEVAKQESQVLLNRIEEETKRTANKKSREILVNTIQRMASEVTSEVTTTSVSLPNDEMKGRIIGREGRNIRTLETLIGVDIIIDDTPEAVVISCFDPVRRENCQDS